jgi:hypothetical protein
MCAGRVTFYHAGPGVWTAVPGTFTDSNKYHILVIRAQ